MVKNDENDALHFGSLLFVNALQHCLDALDLLFVPQGPSNRGKRIVSWLVKSHQQWLMNSNKSPRFVHVLLLDVILLAWVHSLIHGQI